MNDDIDVDDFVSDFAWDRAKEQHEQHEVIMPEKQVAVVQFPMYMSLLSEIWHAARRLSQY